MPSEYHRNLQTIRAAFHDISAITLQVTIVVMNYYTHVQFRARNCANFKLVVFVNVSTSSSLLINIRSILLPIRVN